MKRLGLVGVAGFSFPLGNKDSCRPQSGLPITYLINGRQYIVFAASSAAGGSAQLVAYALPTAPAAGARGGGVRGGGQRGTQQ